MSDPIAQLPGLTNPITHAGRVVYNAQRDSVETHHRKRGEKRGSKRVYKETVMNDGDFTIQPYEVCVRRKRSKYVNGRPTDTDIHVFSSANGILDNSKGQLGPKDRRKAVQGELAFAGVASNRAIYDPNNNANEEMLAVQVGGLQTIYNTGDDDITAGDIVLWEMPLIDDQTGKPKGLVRVPGVDRTKLLFRTRKYKDTLATQNKDGLLAALRDLRGRVIGKALSNARPGKPFDILLGHYMI